MKRLLAVLVAVGFMGIYAPAPAQTDQPKAEKKKKKKSDKKKKNDKRKAEQPKAQ